MTPLEQYDHKRNWMPGYAVRLHSDLTDKGKAWCRSNAERHEWSMTAYTHVYEHTFHFEHPDDGMIFEAIWPKCTNQKQI